MKSFLLLIFISIPALASKKYFIYCSEASPKIFNPQLATDGATFNASSETVYNRLVEFKNNSTTIEPAIAEKWSVSKDSLKYTFYLRKDIKFHTSKIFKPTRNLNADDVMFTFNRMFDKKHPYHKVNGGLYKYFLAMGMDKLIKSINKLDEYTVQFVLNYPEAPFLANLAMKFASILSAEYAEVLARSGQQKLMDFQPIGTGPFVFKKYVKDSVIRFYAFEDHFRGPAKIKKLIFDIVPDASVRFQKLKRRECHLIAEPSPVDIPQMRRHPKITVIDKPGLNVGYLAMNVEKPPLNKVKVRRAIYHALNRSSYIKAIYKGNSTIAKNPMPPTMWSYDTETKDHDYDPVKSKELLKQAGYKNGFKIKLWTLPVSRPYNPNGKKMGEMMQSDLAKVGIKAELVTYKWATYLEKSERGEHELIQLGWTGDNGDPDNFLNILLGCTSIKSGSNVSRWCDKEYNNLMVKAKQTAQIDLRTSMYKKAQVIFNQKTPWVPLAHAKTFRAYRHNVKNYVISPFGTDNFYHVDVEQK